MNNQILFYKPQDNYGCFSNFYAASVILWGFEYPTSEHAYQAQKFDYNSAAFEEIRKADTPRLAAKLGRTRTPFREDWDYLIDPPPDFDYHHPNIICPIERLKDLIMYDTVFAKFTQHADLRDILCNTYDAELVEDSPIDFYWGCGSDGTGTNKLGKILMAVRSRLLFSNR